MVEGSRMSRRSKRQLQPGVATERRTTDERRPEAMRLLAEGLPLSAVARQLQCARDTVRDWRDSPEGQRELEAARKARDLKADEVAEAARRVLRESAARAAQILVDRLDAGGSGEATRAACAILDRVGVPRVERVETTVDSALDMSVYSDEELAVLEALQAKGRRKE